MDPTNKTSIWFFWGGVSYSYSQQMHADTTLWVEIKLEIEETKETVSYVHL